MQESEISNVYPSYKSANKKYYLLCTVIFVQKKKIFL
jgi:hypothetical protein